jgi:hypothetical protein
VACSKGTSRHLSGMTEGNHDGVRRETRSQGRYSKSGSPECEAGVLTTRHVDPVPTRLYNKGFVDGRLMGYTSIESKWL